MERSSTVTSPPSAFASTSKNSRPLQFPSPTPSTSASTSTCAGSSSFNAGSNPHTLEIANYLQVFLPSVIPTNVEYEAKEAARVFLETLAEKVVKGAKLLPFGSMANGFALKNSDMDLCCVLPDKGAVRSAAELVEALGTLIKAETNFHVKMLPRARIPIIKLTMPPTASAPYAMACDIGFENRLALENTRLLLTYAMIDPRLRTMVLFLKVWTKRRKINNPYRGTLSSYGYVLLVIHFLSRVKNPPVLPNLQSLPSPRGHTLDTVEMDGHNIYFFDDVNALPQAWITRNSENVGELLIDFFRYFSKEFSYNTQVVSVRSDESITKDWKGWHADIDYDPDVIVRDLHKLCIEDPFQLDYNVARTVTRDGLYTIRGEFMRAHRLLSAGTTAHISTVINEVCEDREDFLFHHPPIQPPSHHTHSASRRQSMPSPTSYHNSNPAAVPALAMLPNSMDDFRAWVRSTGGSIALESGLSRRIDAQSLAGASGVTNFERSLRIDPRGTVMMVDSAQRWKQDQFSVGYCAMLQAPRQLPPFPPALNSIPAVITRAHVQIPSPSALLERRASWDGSESSILWNTSSSTLTQIKPPRQTPNDMKSRMSFTAPSSPEARSSTFYGHPSTAYDSYIDRPTFPTRSETLMCPSPSGFYGVPSPAPIFPEADRQAIILANSITFGNFPSLLPQNHPYHSAVFSATSRRQLEERMLLLDSEGSDSTSAKMYGVAEEILASHLDASRGRKLMEASRVETEGRIRGRSVPLVRVDADGRESILFGEISVVLPQVDSGDRMEVVAPDYTPHASTILDLENTFYPSARSTPRVDQKQVLLSEAPLHSSSLPVALSMADPQYL